MKVVEIMPEFGLAGAEIMCENLIYGLIDKNIEVVVVSLYTFESAITDRMKARGIRIIYLGKKSGLDFSVYKKLNDVLKTEKPDVVHTHRYVMQYAIPCALINRVQVCVHTVHNVAKKEQDFIKRKQAYLFYHLLKVRAVALSNEIKKTVCAEYKLKENEVPVIFNGEDLSGFRKKDNYQKGERLKILHIGRFMDAKNHKCIMETAIELLHMGQKIELFLVGNYETEIGSKCIEMVRENKCDKYIHFMGLQDNVKPFLENADIFILPSKYEGVPMSLIEAMATGLPIIASNVGGIPDMIDNYESGILITPNKEELKKTIEELSENEGLRKKMGENAYIRSREFDSSKMAERYIAVYKELL